MLYEPSAATLPVKVLLLMVRVTMSPAVKVPAALPVMAMSAAPVAPSMPLTMLSGVTTSTVSVVVVALGGVVSTV